MTKEWAFISGDWWMICDVCGEKHRRSEMKLRWDNLWVDERCWNPRQPQDFVQARIDVISTNPDRPRPADVLIEACTATGRNGVAGYGTSGCSIAGFFIGI